MGVIHDPLFWTLGNSCVGDDLQNLHFYVLFFIFSCFRGHPRPLILKRSAAPARTRGMKHTVICHWIKMKYVTWSRGMSWMSGILILSYRLREVTNFCVLYCFSTSKNIHISTTRCLIEMGFGSKCRILNRQVIYIENSKLNIADMWLIPLDRVTYVVSRMKMSHPWDCAISVMFVVLHSGQTVFLWPKIYQCVLPSISN